MLLQRHAVARPYVSSLRGQSIYGAPSPRFPLLHRANFSYATRCATAPLRPCLATVTVQQNYGRRYPGNNHYSPFYGAYHSSRTTREEKKENDTTTPSTTKKPPVAKHLAAPMSLEMEEKEEKDKKGQTKALFKRLVSLIKPEYKLIGTAMVALVIASSANLMFPAGMGKIIDAVVNPNEAEYTLFQISAGLGGVFAIGAITDFIRTAFMHIATNRVVARLRKQLFTAILQQEIAFFDANKTGELINRLASDIVVVAKTLTDYVAGGTQRIAEGIGGLAILLYIAPKLTLVVVGVLPPVFLGGYYYGRWVKKLSKKVQASLGDAAQFAEERISNIRTVKVFTREAKEEGAYGKKVDYSFSLSKKEGIAKGAFSGGLKFAGYVGLLSIVGYGGSLVVDGQMTVGDLTSFLLYSTYVGFALSGVAEFYADLMKGIGASTRVFQLLEREPKIPPETGTELDRASVRGEIGFNNVTFRYPTRPGRVIFSDFNLHIDAGKTVAVVGESGSGKSTVVGLLARFYDPEKGTVTLDGHELKSVDPRSVRRQLGFVSQDVVLFSGTIGENIAYGIPQTNKLQSERHDTGEESGYYGTSATREQVEDAARRANAHDFISAFPDGYDTQVGERGVTLSGGQKQRIAIARALIRNPPILVLDEATSALDSTSERLVQQALTEVMKGRTNIIIAHRLSTIKNADEIAVLHQGRIVERGPHDELMARDGHYKRLVTQQIQNA